MNVCPACGQPNDDTARFCRECRTKLDPRVRLSPGTTGPEIGLPPAPKPTGIGWRDITAILVATIGAIAIGAFVIASLRNRDPLRAQVTPDSAEAFASAVLQRIERLEQAAETAADRIGPGAEEVVGPVRARLGLARNLVLEIELTDDPDSLATLRQAIVNQLDSARIELDASR